MAVVTLEQLSKRYKGTTVPAVQSVSMTVADGEFMVLLGPSGCGKSTTLRMIAGLESITDGKLSIDGRVVNNVPSKDRDIAMVFQSYALYPHMTVAQNLAFGLKRRRIESGEIDRRVRKTAKTLGLDELLERKPFALSGGQRQRVALGRAIVREPKVFLFDEPLSNLDAALRVSTRNELIRLHHHLAATMIYVTHDQVEAMTMGQRICVMNKGEVAQLGKPLAVYRQPADAFVARFLGNPPMNLLPGQLVDGSERAIEFGGTRFSPQRWTSELLASNSRGLLVGVRPEDIAVDEPGATPSGAARGIELRGAVAAVEPLGAETLVVVELTDGAGEVTARLHRDVAAAIGDAVSLKIGAEAIYLFDGATQKALVAYR